MPAGLQVWNNSLTFQIDGTTPMITLARKGTVGTSSPEFPTNAAAGSLCVARIPIGADEILATDCGYPFLQTGVRYGNAEFVIQGTTATTMDYWVFTPHTPSGTRVGMEIYSETGALIYDTGRPPMRVAGTVEGLGTFGGFPTNKRLALVVWAQHSMIQRQVLVNPVPNTGFTAVFGNFSRAQQDGTVVIGSTIGYAVFSGPIGSNTVNFAGTWDNGIQNKFTVVDVTGM